MHAHTTSPPYPHRQVDSAAIAVDKAEAEAALEAAMPALEEAAAALKDLKKDDINMVKSYSTPPPAVQKVRECGAGGGMRGGGLQGAAKGAGAVCPDPCPTPAFAPSCRQVGECVVLLKNYNGCKEVNWAAAKAMMADTNFLRSLLEFDKDGLSEKTVGCCTHCSTPS